MPMRTLALMLSLLTTVPVTGAGLSSPPIHAPEAIVMDAASGEVLFAKDATTARPPASMTKLMTLYLVADAIEKGRVHLTDRVPVSMAAYKTGGAQIWLEPGEALPVSQLMRAIAIGSANDACVAVAEHVAGSEAAFVDQMNQTARRLGMRGTHFANSHGLDDPHHLTTARDMAVLARAVLEKPMIVKALVQREDRTIRNGRGGKLWIINHNKLLWRYPGILGLKTGYTSGAGFCLTSAAHRQGMTVIAVVMGDATSKDRFEDAAALMNWAFQTHVLKLVVPGGKVLGHVTVAKGETERVAAVTPHDVRVMLAQGSKVKTRITSHLKTSIPAPVRAGERLGTVTAAVGDKRVSAPLVAKTSVARASLSRTFVHLLRGALHVGT